jgi:hypothetical protein
MIGFTNTIEKLHELLNNQTQAGKGREHVCLSQKRRCSSLVGTQTHRSKRWDKSQLTADVDPDGLG